MISEAGTVTLAQLQLGLEDRLEAVREEVRRLIAADFSLISDVNDHLLQMQGKLFRPTIVFLVDEATGRRSSSAVDDCSALTRPRNGKANVPSGSTAYSPLRPSWPSTVMASRSPRPMR